MDKIKIDLSREEAVLVSALLGHINVGKGTYNTYTLVNKLVEVFEICDDELSEEYDCFHFVPREITTSLDINNRHTIDLMNMEVIYRKG